MRDLSHLILYRAHALLLHYSIKTACIIEHDGMHGVMHYVFCIYFQSIELDSSFIVTRQMSVSHILLFILIDF